MPQAKIVSLHRSRREADEEANKLHNVLIIAREIVHNNPETAVRKGVANLLTMLNIPGWAQSIRSEKDGFRKWAVMASENPETKEFDV